MRRLEGVSRKELLERHYFLIWMSSWNTLNTDLSRNADLGVELRVLKATSMALHELFGIEREESGDGRKEFTSQGDWESICLNL